MRKFTEKLKAVSRAQLQRGLGLGLLVLLAVSLPLIGLGTVLSSGQNLVEWVRVHGLWTWPVFVLVAGMAAGFALVPSHLSSLLAGYLYGLWLGLPAALLVVLIGCGIGAALSRKMSRDLMRKLIDQSRWGRILTREFVDANDRKATGAVALARLPPQVPFALGNILAASFGVRSTPLFLGTLTGMLPRVFLVVWLGAGLSAWEPGLPVPGSLWLAVIAGFVGMGGLMVWGGMVLASKGDQAESSRE